MLRYELPQVVNNLFLIKNACSMNFMLISGTKIFQTFKTVEGGTKGSFHRSVRVKKGGGGGFVYQLAPTCHMLETYGRRGDGR